MVISELLQVTPRLKAELPWLTEAKFFDKVDSTQKRILQFLPKTGEGAVLVLAETQTKAVGRQGRPWASPPGGVWMTVALPMGGRTPAQIAPFAVVAALLTSNALKEVFNLDTQIKWPNDVICQEKKLGGILITTTEKSKKGWVLIGIGVNVNNDVPAGLADTATSIKAIRKQSQGRSRFLETLLAAVWAAWQDFDKTGFGPYLRSVEGRLSGTGTLIRVLLGTRVVEGKQMGIDPQGSLLLQSSGETTPVHAGEILAPTSS